LNTEIDTSELVDRLRVGVDALISQLNDWNKRWQATQSQAYVEVPQTIYMAYEHARINIDLPPSLNIVYQYDSIGAATSLCMYHSARILLTKLAIKTISPTVEPGRQKELMSDLSKAAFAICRSIHYHLQESHNTGGSFFLLMPLKIAYPVLEFMGYEEEHKWAERCFLDIAGLLGSHWAAAEDTKSFHERSALINSTKNGS
jgi:hypothetical protein